MAAHGYVHYEITHFCRPPRYAKHNTRYFQGNAYLGIGPSAHSYDGESRQYNVMNNKAYVEAIAQDVIPAQREVLTSSDHINEYIMLSLRTMWGCDLAHLRTFYDHDLVAARAAEIDEAKQYGLLKHADDRLVLTPRGFSFADGVIADLMVG